MTLKISRNQVSTQPNPTHQKLKNSDPTQPMDGPNPWPTVLIPVFVWVCFVLFTIGPIWLCSVCDFFVLSVGCSCLVVSTRAGDRRLQNDQSCVDGDFKPCWLAYSPPWSFCFSLESLLLYLSFFWLSCGLLEISKINLNFKTERERSFTMHLRAQLFRGH